MTIENESMSNKAISERIEQQMGLMVSPEAIRKIRHEFGFKWGAAQRVPDLTADQMIARMEFATEFEKERFQELRQFTFVFSDESRFCSKADNANVWKRSGVRRKSNLAHCTKFAKISIMVWGAIGLNFKSKLLILEGSVNAQKYIDALNGGFFTDADLALQQGQWVFVQDGAKPHTTDQVLQEITRHCRLCPFWPANSPDLNPIEMVWAIMKARMKWRGIETKEEAIQKITEIWEGISMDVINALCASFPARVELMKEAGGETIQPLLSSHTNHVPDGYLSDRVHIVSPGPWSAEEDAQLMRMTEAGKRVSSQNLGYFPGRSIASVRNRWRTLNIDRLNRETRGSSINPETQINSVLSEQFARLFE
jgi:transposase